MSLIRLIDHAVLRPEQTEFDVRAACALCLELETASVCVKPSMAALASQLLSGSVVVASTVIGFPHGGTTTAAKVRETEIAVQDGVREVDMVVNLGWVLADEWQRAEDDIQAVAAAARAGGALTKVILETGLLGNDQRKIRLCHICARAEVAFVKTSTGFGYAADACGKLQATGATEHDVALLRANCSPHIGVKASGGIRSAADARKMVAMGANRLGTSATREIASEERGQVGSSGANY